MDGADHDVAEPHCVGAHAEQWGPWALETRWAGAKLRCPL